MLNISRNDLLLFVVELIPACIRDHLAYRLQLVLKLVDCDTPCSLCSP